MRTKYTPHFILPDFIARKIFDEGQKQYIFSLKNFLQFSFTLRATQHAWFRSRHGLQYCMVARLSGTRKNAEGMLLGY
jgi:hypothetical protein